MTAASFDLNEESRSFHESLRAPFVELRGRSALVIR